jgi:hypothetical protein
MGVIVQQNLTLIGLVENPALNQYPDNSNVTPAFDRAGPL